MCPLGHIPLIRTYVIYIYICPLGAARSHACAVGDIMDIDFLLDGSDDYMVIL